jgi:hypothetical protein
VRDAHKVEAMTNIDRRSVLASATTRVVDLHGLLVVSYFVLGTFLAVVGIVRASRGRS